MAEDAEQNGSGISSYLVPIMLVLTALAGGFSWQPPPLSSFRPAAHAQKPVGSNSSQNIEARLWQDPLGAIDQVKVDAGVSGNVQPGQGNFHPLGSQDMQNMLEKDYEDYKGIESGTNYSLHVLLAMTPGGMYAEDVESRLRAREAVLSALSVAGYCEEQEDMIGCWNFRWPDNSMANQAPDLSSRLLPFERFVPKHDGDFLPTAGNCVLVIWVPDLFFQEFPSAPLRGLARLVDEVRKFPLSKPDQVRIDILGPVDSSILYEMLHEQGNKDGGPDPNEEFTGGKVRMFSWAATAEDKLLMEGTTLKETSTDLIRTFFQYQYGLDFYNTTARDDDLSRELVDELNLRGVDLTDRCTHVALFYEWDTYYGRTLPTSFTNYVASLQKAKSLQPVPAADCDYGYATGSTPNLHRFTYLRGIDGLTQAEQQDKQAGPQDQGSAEKSASNQNKSDANGMNRSEGENQLDYIERVAIDLQRLRDDLETGRYPGGKPLFAKPIRYALRAVESFVEFLRRMQPRCPMLSIGFGRHPATRPNSRLSQTLGCPSR